jgi:hypothetical protein
MADEKHFEAWINPLAFLQVDQPWADAVPSAISHEAILSYACQPGISSDLDSLIGRYRQISNEPVRLIAAPNEERILDKLVWPLRHAKASYMFGNYLSVIALCGMVGEMVAIVCWELGGATLRGAPMNKADERALLGSEFERLGQERRVQILGAYGMIDAEMRGRFDRLRDVRRKYLHIWTQDHESLSGDARGCFVAAVSIVTTVLGQDISEGRIMLNPRVLEYLERKAGVCTSGDDTI